MPVFRLCLCTILLTTAANAQQPDLTTLSTGLDRLPMLKNVYLREDAAGELRTQAAAFAGMPYEVTAIVRRVTRNEVELHLKEPRKIRLVLQHASSPRYGNLGTIFYIGGPSVQRANLLSQPTTLRIGSEIDLNAARGLTHGQELQLRGKLAVVHLHLDRWFKPQAIAVLDEWQVSSIAPQP